MHSRILILRFPATGTNQPVVCYLARNFDLTFNILKATILPRKEGIMVLELSGSKKNFKDGVQYLKDTGIDVQNASREVNRVKNKCIHCGACTAVCPTSALAVHQPDMAVIFEQKKCSICELCVPACPTRAMEVHATSEAFFA